MSPTVSERRLSAPMRRGIVALCVAMAFVLSGCGAVIGTTLKVNDDGSGSRSLTVTFTNDDSDEAKQMFAKPLSVYDASIKKHVPSQLTYNGLHMQGKSMVASFQLDFSSPQDYLTKVRAIIRIRLLTSRTSTPRWLTESSARRTSRPMTFLSGCRTVWNRTESSIPATLGTSSTPRTT